MKLNKRVFLFLLSLAISSCSSHALQETHRSTMQPHSKKAPSNSSTATWFYHPCKKIFGAVTAITVLLQPVLAPTGAAGALLTNFPAADHSFSQVPDFDVKNKAHGLSENNEQTEDRNSISQVSIA